jgi:hypothetical protein
MTRSLLASLLVLVACGAGDRRESVITTTGTIEFQDVEGGAWLVRTVEGTAYRPLNLPAEFEQVGARVQVRLVERKDVVGVPLPGLPADLLSISMLPPVATACAWPAAADTYQDGTGCQPRPTFENCEQTITPAGPTTKCSEACSPDEFALECRGAFMASTPAPAPDSVLRCRVYPIPTPPDVTFYCCPCEP